MKCSVCGYEFENSPTCPACNTPAPPPPPPPPPAYQQPYQQAPYPQAPYPQAPYPQAPFPQQPAEIMSDKSRNTFALLGFFLGFFGVHQFYLGKIGNGIATILATFLCSPFLVQFCVGIELMTTHRDSDRALLRDNDSPLAVILGILMMLGNIVLGILWFTCFLVPFMDSL